MTRLSARWNGVIFPLMLSIVMTAIVSAIATLRLLGPAPGFLAEWIANWALSWVVGFPVLLAVLPLVRRFVATFVEPPRPR